MLERSLSEETVSVYERLRDNRCLVAFAANNIERIRNKRVVRGCEITEPGEKKSADNVSSLIDMKGIEGSD
ncbi:hypothetical protein K9857_07450 [Pseudomonas sp. REP124]|uniref:hypothetical protein n=1 Tax=Pseudomonas sp. REP124 TaxID=2875731 RepID=UPI001CCACD30|nr:hypothetical protein [Pseudomonas sp. REP124]MBZ9781386.1 hypothetical protein [Pseudomonas sp. REP124]